MSSASQQLDRRLAALHGSLADQRPASGWVRAVRDALGMTTAQLARRLGVSQPRVSELEKAEASGNVTVQSLERAAEALGCRLVYAFVPIKPLSQTLDERATGLAAQRMAAVDQTMRLEDQSVVSADWRAAQLQDIKRKLLDRPARLWDEM